MPRRAGLKIIAMHGMRGDEQEIAGRKRTGIAIDTGCGAAVLDHDQLRQLTVAMGGDGPPMAGGTVCDPLDMDDVRKRGGFAVECEDGDMAGHGHVRFLPAKVAAVHSSLACARYGRPRKGK